MDLEAALPRLLISYRRGVLVPFIGSGMSMPACKGWLPFVAGLAEAVGDPPGALEDAEPSSTALYRKADSCVRRLKARGYAELVRVSRQALGLAAEPTLPPQTRALAALHWPLVMTTNYDDLLLRAAYERRDQSASGQDRSVFELAGQSVQDCHTVLRSLDQVTPPVLWALQGYLGGPNWTQPPLTERRVRQLEREVVIGHQQYQAVINAQPHLRRAVAEVFRRRSLLFLGSGVQEDYLLNLFSEIIHHHGVSAHTHVAVFHDSARATVDEPFFRLRLGIEPVFISDYAEIPALLTRLRNNISSRVGVPDSRTRSAGCEPYELAYRLGGRPLTLRIRHDAPAPGSGCVGVSVGREHGRIALGPQAQAVMRAFHVKYDPATTWKSCDKRGYVYRHPKAIDLFAIAAREANTQKEDRRHLMVIPDALRAFLSHADDLKYEHASVGLLAAGQGRPWPALYPFVMMLQAIHDYTPRNLREIVICLVDPSVWFPVIAGKVPIDLLLSADSGVSWIHIFGDADDAPDSYALTLAGGATVTDVARACGLPRGRWLVAVYPTPSGGRSVADPGWIAVIPGATVSFTATSDPTALAFELTG